jgi:1-acyl-sn-glycerol-3-phosphate acyltransferase
MGPLKWLVTYGCKLGLRMIYRIEASEMARIRAEGPLILYTNHRGNPEAPIIYTFLAPRKKVTGLSKIENWHNPFLGLVFSLWGIIPLRRGETDMEAMSASFDALAKGYILGLAPEGTRSKTGQLQRAFAGISLLALRSRSPMQPIAHWEERPAGRILGIFRRRPSFNIRVGRALRLDLKGLKITRDIRQEMTDEIMYQLAALLPAAFRGEYADPSLASEKWLVFED